MSHDQSPNVPAHRERRNAVREKAQQVQARQSRLRWLRRGGLTLLAVGVVTVAAVMVTWAVGSSMSRPELRPQNVTDDGFAVTSVSGVAAPEVAAAPDDATASATVEATPEATPTPTPTPTEAAVVDIRVYVDYLSTGSREFQLANVQQLKTWVSQGAADLTYHPVAMLTAKSNGTKYSLRAAAAAACVATHSPEEFFAFNDALLREQPEVDTDGFTDSQLADLAQAAGAESPKLVRSCIEEESYLDWARDATERALNGIPETEGVTLTGTPMVLVNGVPYVGALDDPQEFSQFVLTIGSDAYYKTASPSPTQTPSPAATP
ncbi:thioredoxin domain-containing protein [Microbacterium sp. CCNWLW134]|uniref:DsbA family protein n=1 Tax=Microbacterium sp. CCNWLW134 TaxID=3122064 RepID=UPI00300FFAD8